MSSNLYESERLEIDKRHAAIDAHLKILRMRTEAEELMRKAARNAVPEAVKTPGDGVIEAFENKVHKLTEKIAELESQMETKLSYKGIWREGENYRKNDMTTHAGSGWICQKNTSVRPGANGFWKLMTKNGGLPK